MRACVYLYVCLFEIPASKEKADGPLGGGKKKGSVKTAGSKKKKKAPEKEKKKKKKKTQVLKYIYIYIYMYILHGFSCMDKKFYIYKDSCF